MLTFIVRRFLAVIPVFAIITILVFLMLRLTPGDPAVAIAGDDATASNLAEIRQRLGLTDSILVQFLRWFGNLLHGDLGESFFFKRSVASLIAQRIEPTLALAACTILLSVLVAVPLGVLAASRQGSLLDRAVMGFSVLGFSVPVFVIGYLMIYVFAIELGWLPVQGYTRIGESFWGFLQRIAMPTLSLTVAYVALIARTTRSSMLEILHEDFIRTARAKGLPNRTVLLRHALRNAAIPILTVIGGGVALLISGAVVTESVYAIPGLGRLTIEAVLSRDFPTVQAVILLFSGFYVVVNLLIDITYTLLDPRIRY